MSNFMSDAVSFPSDSTQFSRLLHFTARAWRLAIDRRLKAQGLNQASWVTVSTIAGADAPLTQSELAAALGLEGATVVSMIDKLVRQGLVERVMTPEDRRKRLLVVTEAGQAMYRQVKGEADALRETLLASLNEQELAVTMRVLDTLRHAAEQSR
ncbi:MAG: MarR family transcriptional regulator [Yersiniaceae bacterium]|nr:MarR family transcriptional regulator [Chimaeribacter coloradensis]MDU6411397.1 MarR family transcriptional regulator [Yersiniaceae bacterium]